MQVVLRQRKKSKRISLYLDVYSKGTRQYEYLNLYLLPVPEKGQLTSMQKEENKRVLALAEAIRSRRAAELQSGQYGIKDVLKRKGSLIQYIELLAEKKNQSKGNYDNWISAIKHFKAFVKSDVTFEQIDEQLLIKFKDYLGTDARKPNGSPLAINSQAAYFSKIRAGLKKAYNEGYLSKDVGRNMEGIKPQSTERIFLTLEEVRALAKAKCHLQSLKHAFLFSVLTGLRWSDIEKLIWSEVQHSEQLGYYIRFRQKKTKAAETLPISEEARQLLGQKSNDSERVFPELSYSVYNNVRLVEWAAKAGIQKHVTFHTARHSFATLQLSVGTDIYTLSKLLGHKNLKTTEVYAHIIDEQKIKAVSKIKL